MVFGPDMGSEWIFDRSLPWEAIEIDSQRFFALREYAIEMRVPTLAVQR